MEWNHSSKTLHEVIQEMMQSLGTGIQFEEWNAPNIDISQPFRRNLLNVQEHMKADGFNVHIYIDPSNGVVVGGNVGSYYGC